MTGRLVADHHSLGLCQARKVQGKLPAPFLHKANQGVTLLYTGSLRGQPWDWSQLTESYPNSPASAGPAELRGPLPGFPAEPQLWFSNICWATGYVHSLWHNVPHVTDQPHLLFARIDGRKGQSHSEHFPAWSFSIQNYTMVKENI
jgi:hypothetical protein